jgi:hypothetical protein
MRWQALLYIITFSYFVTYLIAGFVLFQYLWFTAFTAPGYSYPVIITVNDYGEAWNELVLFIGWLLTIIVMILYPPCKTFRRLTRG